MPELKQPNKRFTCTAARVLCWLLCNLPSPKASSCFLQSCFFANPTPVLRYGLLHLGEGLCCWTLEFSWQTISPACGDLHESVSHDLQCINASPKFSSRYGLPRGVVQTDGDEHHSEHVKCCQPQYHQLISVRLPYISTKCSKIQISLGPFFFYLAVIMFMIYKILMIYKQTYFCIAFNQNTCLSDTQW